MACIVNFRNTANDVPKFHSRTTAHLRTNATKSHESIESDFPIPDLTVEPALKNPPITIRVLDAAPRSMMLPRIIKPLVPEIANKDITQLRVKVEMFHVVTTHAANLVTISVVHHDVVLIVVVTRRVPFESEVADAGACHSLVLV